MPPDMGCVKLNFDEAIFKEVGKSGMSGLIQNHEGFVLAAIPYKFLIALAPEVVDIMSFIYVL